MRKTKNPFNDGAIIILFMMCALLLVLLLQTVIGSKKDRETGAEGSIRTEDKTQEIPLILPESQEGQQTGDGVEQAVTIGQVQELQEAISSQIQELQELIGGHVQEPLEIKPEILPEIDEGIQTENQWEEIVQPQEPEVYEFMASDKSYFDDALFIGDSRTVGLREYGTLDNADYFANAGLNLYTVGSAKLEIQKGAKITLEEMLSQKSYGKVYLMLGINELGYNYDTTIEKYGAFVDYLQQMQPDAILYVCANLHVNSLRNQVDEIHNNAAINRINEVIAGFADQKDIFYLDVNPLFDDENGNLADEYTSDDSHLLGKHYVTWCDWYLQNTIVK